MTRNFKMIACKVLLRELYSLAYNCPNAVDITWLRQKLHETPDRLRQEVQDIIDRIDATEGDPCEAILLGYGLCSNGIVGLRSRRYPLVIPRAHDCITFLLGSKERYRQEFEGHSGGIYWCVLFYGGHSFPYAFYRFRFCAFMRVVVSVGLSAQPL